MEQHDFSHRIRMTSLGFVSLLVCGWVQDPSPTQVQAATDTKHYVVVTIDNTKEHQIMDGFGATHLSLVYQGKGDVLTANLRARAIDAVYHQVGISMGNLEGALLEGRGGYAGRANDDTDPFHFNWDAFQTFMADAIKANVVDLARPLGFDNYFPGQKINVRWASPWLAKLRRADYDAYLDEAAEQVAAGAIYWRRAYGAAPQYLMLFNEPLSGNRELLNGTARDVVDLVKRTGARLRREGFPGITFVLPNEETEEKSLDTARAVLADPGAGQYVGAIGYHTYPYGSVYASIPRILGTSGSGKPDSGRIVIRKRLRELAHEHRIPIWMTEVSHGNVDPRSFDDLRGRAIHIHDELVYADAAAYFGMNNMWDAVSHRLHFGGRNPNLFSEEGSIALIENEVGSVQITGMGYAIGHYARWVQRGATRIEARSSDPLVLVTAFRAADRRRLILVMINNAPGARQVDVALTGGRLGGDLSGELSDAGSYWRALKPIALLEPRVFTLTVPAMSVVTVVGALLT